MKRAKFALTAVAVLAVVGGALAFKASRQAEANVYRNTTLDGKVQCKLLSVIPDYTTATNGAAFTTIANASFVSKTASCNTPVSIYVLD